MSPAFNKIKSNIQPATINTDDSKQMKSYSSDSNSPVSSLDTEQSEFEKVVDEKNQTFTLKIRISEILIKNLNLLDKLRILQKSEPVIL